MVFLGFGNNWTTHGSRSSSPQSTAFLSNVLSTVSTLFTVFGARSASASFSYSVDADGYYWYAGRADDMFKVSGLWVSPIEIESTLVEHPSVLEAAVIAFEEESRLHTAKAFVVLRQDCPAGPELAKDLQDFVKAS